jgi:uroporphyrinogen decarboxylase
MTPRQRVEAALRGETVDRPPVSFWGHFYHRESSAQDLVDATLEFQRRYQWDWIKLNPRRHYHAEPWGVRWTYSGVPDEKPKVASVPIRTGEDWSTIDEQPHDRGALAEQLDAVRRLRQGLGPDVPFVETVFTPLAILREMVREPRELREHLDTHAGPVRHALESVTRTFEKFVPAVLEAGADGIFFATVDWASRDQLSAEEYRRWARPFDERVLAAMSRGRFNVLHVCKRNNLLFELADYPVHAFSWAANDPSNPTLADALKRIRGAAMGGISHEDALLEPDSGRVLAEFRSGLDETHGRRWLVAPGCSIPPRTPAANLRAIRDAVESAHVTSGPP